MTAIVGLRRRLAHLAVTLAALTIALAAAELLVRVFAPVWLRARMREVTVGRSLGN